MSDIWTPSAPAVSCTATVINQRLVVASNQLTSSIRFLNSGTTVGFCAVVSASASGGDAANAVPLAGGASIFIEAGLATQFGFVSGASAVYAQAGYALK